MRSRPYCNECALSVSEYTREFRRLATAKKSCTRSYRTLPVLWHGAEMSDPEITPCALSFLKDDKSYTRPHVRYSGFNLKQVPYVLQVPVFPGSNLSSLNS